MNELDQLRFNLALRLEQFRTSHEAYRAAIGRRQEAQTALDAAAITLGEAEFAARGILPNTYVVTSGGDATGFYFGHRVGSLGEATPEVASLTKSGAPHKSRRYHQWHKPVWEPRPA